MSKHATKYLAPYTKKPHQQTADYCAYVSLEFQLKIRQYLVVQDTESQSTLSLLQLDVLYLRLPHGQRRSQRLIRHIFPHHLLRVSRNQETVEVSLYLQSYTHNVISAPAFLTYLELIG